MTQLVVFNDENNEEDSLLSCDVPSFDAGTGPVSQLEEALEKISSSSTYPDLPLPDNQYSWEPDPRFSISLTDFLLSDQDTKFDFESSVLRTEDTLVTETGDDHAQLSKMNDYSASSTSMPYRQMDLSPRSVVDISSPNVITRRSPYCIIRSSHSATAAAAAATAAMIVNDDAVLSASKSSSSLLDQRYSPPAKRQRVHEESESEALSTTSTKKDDGERGNQAITTVKSERMSVLVPNAHRSGTLKPKGEKLARGGAPTRKVLNSNPGAAIKKEAAVIGTAGLSKALTKEELSAIERARQCRAEALVRFRKKKSIRSFGRKVRYECRKRIATTRPRVNGRFAKKSDLKAIQKA